MFLGDVLRRARKTRLDEAIDLLWLAIIYGVLALSIFTFLNCLTGCASVATQSAQPLPPKYQLTLAGYLDNVPYKGVAVGSSAKVHDVIIQSNISVNYFTVQTCHRSTQFTDVIDVGWLDSGHKSYRWTYSESPTIEDDGDCLLRMCAFSKVVGSPPSSCAVIDFKSDRYTLPGENICNGADGQATGTMICHTSQGLLERVKFKAPVVVAPQLTSDGKTYLSIHGQCDGHFIDSNQTIFEYTMPQEECSLIFMESAKPHRRAKLTVIPFSTAIYQGAN